MKTRITDFVKRLFTRKKNQPVMQPEPPKKGSLFQPHRSKPPSKWILTHNRLIRQRAEAIRKRRKKNKVARKSRKVNR